MLPFPVRRGSPKGFGQYRKFERAKEQRLCMLCNSHVEPVKQKIIDVLLLFIHANEYETVHQKWYSDRLRDQGQRRKRSALWRELGQKNRSRNNYISLWGYSFPRKINKNLNK